MSERCRTPPRSWDSSAAGWPERPTPSTLQGDDAVAAPPILVGRVGRPGYGVDDPVGADPLAAGGVVAALAPGVRRGQRLPVPGTVEDWLHDRHVVARGSGRRFAHELTVGPNGSVRQHECAQIGHETTPATGMRDRRAGVALGAARMPHPTDFNDTPEALAGPRPMAHHGDRRPSTRGR